MKKNLLYLLLAMCFVGTMVSCDKDEDGENGSSVFTLNGDEFKPNDVCELWHYASDSYFDMHIWDGSLYLSYGKIEGRGDWLQIELYTESDFATGTYTVDDSGDLGTCDAYMRIGAHTSSEGYLTSDESYSFTSGTVEVGNVGEGKTYKVTVDLSNEEGKVCKGSATISFGATSVN